MSYQDFVEMSRANKAAKKASELNATMQRAGALLQTVVNNMAAKSAAEQQAAQASRPTTPCQRALRQIVMSRKNASDTRTPIDRIRDLLDAKVASDPALRAMRTLGEARARKEALEVKQQRARNVTMETPRHPAPAPEKPLEGQENKDEGRSVTFSDGRTVSFPANGTTPVKSASDYVQAVLSMCRRAAVKEAAQPTPEEKMNAMRQAIAAVYGETLGNMNDPKALQRKWNIVSRGRNAQRVMEAYNKALLGGSPAPAQGGSSISNPRQRSEIYNPPAATAPSAAKPLAPTFQANRVQRAANQQMASIQAANQLARQQSEQAKGRANLIGKLSNMQMLFKKPAPKRIVTQSPDTAARNAAWMANRKAQKAQQAADAARDARYAAFGLGPGRNTPNNQVAGK